jgi:hypothetical protein
VVQELTSSLYRGLADVPKGNKVGYYADYNDDDDNGDDDDDDDNNKDSDDDDDDSHDSHDGHAGHDAGHGDGDGNNNGGVAGRTRNMELRDSRLLGPFTNALLMLWERPSKVEAVWWLLLLFVWYAPLLSPPNVALGRPALLSPPPPVALGRPA